MASLVALVFKFAMTSLPQSVGLGALKRDEAGPRMVNLS